MTPVHRARGPRRRVRALLASALFATAGLAGAATPPALQEGKGGAVTLPAGFAGIENDARVFLRPGGPRVEFVHELGDTVRDFALRGDMLVLAYDDGVRLMQLEKGKPPRALARLALPGTVNTVTVSGDTAWLTGPGGLYAVDIAQAERPRLRAAYEGGEDRGAPLDFLVHGGKGYLLYTNALHVLDLPQDTDGSPALLFKRDFDFEAHAMAADADELFIAAGADGLMIMSTSDHTADPRPGFRATGEAIGIAISDGRLYLAGGADGLTVLAREDGGALRWLGSLRGMEVDGFSVAGNRGLAHGRGGLFLLDVANPQAMERTALLWPDGGPFETAVARMPADSHALALAGERLVGFDLDAPPPRDSNEGLALGQGVNFGGQRRIHLDGGLAYVADWFSGLHIYDVGDPAHPVLLSSFHSAGSPKGVVVRERVAYVADDDHGLLVLDVADPSRPRELARLALPGLAYTPVLDGDMLYLAAHHGGVLIVDVSDPRAPALLAHYDTPGKSWSLRVRSGIAYVADDDAGLLILDVGDVRAPKAIGRYQPGGRIEEIVIDDSIAYVALYEGAIHVLDIGDPATPRVLARLRTPGNARGLALRDGLLYVADWLAGVQIVDVSDPAQPRPIGTRDTDGAAWGIALRGDTALVADWWGGIATLDVSDPERPAPLGGYPRRTAVTATAALDDFVFAAQGDGGVQVFEASNPLNPTWVTGVELRGVGDALALGGRLWVLHEGGTRIAAIDVSNPFEARLSADLALGYPARALRAAGEALLALGEQEYTLIDERPGLQHRHMLHAGVIDAVASHGVVLLAAGDGRLMTLARDGSPDRVLAEAGPGAIERVIATDECVLAQLRGEGLRVLEWNDPPDATNVAAALRETARIPVPRPIDALALDGDRVYFASGLDVQALDISKPDDWRIAGAWRTMSAVSAITVHRDTLYLAGAESLRALSPAPAAGLTAVTDGVIRIEIPPLLPPGSYDIGAARAPLAEPLARDVLRVEPLRLGGKR